MPVARWSIAAAVALLVPLRAATAAEPGAAQEPVASFTSLSPADPATPFQRSLRRTLGERAAASLPVPSSVEYSYQVLGEAGAAPSARPGALEAAPAAEPGRRFTVIGRTVVRFDEPEQAGYPGAWPRLLVRNKSPADSPLRFLEGDYTDAYRDLAAARLPGVWDLYAFGREPRTHVIEETITVTWPDGPAEAGLQKGASPAELPLSPAGPEGILLGFTYTGPHIDYTIGDTAEVCIPIIGCATIYDFKAGFELDWGLGLRLPAQADLLGPTVMVAGSSSTYSSAVGPLDWSGAAYSAVGVAPESGNEWVLRFAFFVGVRGEIVGIDLCPSCYISVDIDKSASFATPFGPGAFFPIPPAQVPIREFGVEDLFYFALGLQIQPLLGSQKITANWQASGAASGSGALTYSSPGAPLSFVASACLTGPSHDAQVQVGDFKYWFDQFLVELDAYLTFQLFGFGIWTPTIEIATFDLSPITAGLWVGRHTQCNATFSCGPVGPDNTVTLPVSVADQAAPTSSIALAGTAGNAGWWVSNVVTTLSATDNPPGCGIGVAGIEWATDGTWNAYAGPFTLATEGVTTVSYRATDADLNVEAPRAQVVMIDKSPPVVTGAPTTPANGHGWYNHDVVVHFDATDAFSGVAAVTPDQTLGGEGAGQSVTGTATDVAGNSASTTVTGINIDETAPGVFITSPLAAVYPNTATVEIRWLATDALSGIAWETGALDGAPVANGQGVDLVFLPGGTHAVSAMAVDRADNVGAAALTFTVDVDIDGLLAALERVCQPGWIDKPGICHSLEVKLAAAKASIARGNLGAAANQLRAFLNELEAQNGKAVNPQAYDLLRADALYVLAHLG